MGRGKTDSGSEVKRRLKKGEKGGGAGVTVREQRTGYYFFLFENYCNEFL